MLTEDGTFSLFFRPLPCGFDRSRVPTPQEFAIQGKKKMLMPGGQPGGEGGRGEALAMGAAGID